MVVPTNPPKHTEAIDLPPRQNNYKNTPLLDTLTTPFKTSYKHLVPFLISETMQIWKNSIIKAWQYKWRQLLTAIISFLSSLKPLQRKTSFTWNSQPWAILWRRVFFKIKPPLPICNFNTLKNISMPQVRVNIMTWGKMVMTLQSFGINFKG